MNNYGAKLKLSIGLLIIAVVFVLLSLNSNAAVSPSIITYQGKILVDGTTTSTPLTMTFELFNSSTSYIGETSLYTTTNLITPSSGLFSVLLGGSGTNPLNPEIFRTSDEIYLQVTVEGQVLSPRKRIVSVPYAFNAMYLNGLEATSTPTNTAYIPVTDDNGNITFNSVTTTGDLNVEGELKISQTSTLQNVVPESNGIFSLGSAVWRWLKGWFVDLDVINLFAINADIGTSTITNATITSSTLTSTTIINAGITNLNAENVTTTGDLYVSGTLRTGDICSKDGSFCFNIDELNITVKEMRTTSVKYVGNVTTTPALRGYQAANTICSAFWTGSHFCKTEEIMTIIEKQNISYFSGTAWLANGPPGYTAPANDCSGWTSSDGNRYGAIWQFNSDGGGSGYLTTCNQPLPLACCK